MLAADLCRRLAWALVQLIGPISSDPGFSNSLLRNAFRESGRISKGGNPTKPGTSIALAAGCAAGLAVVTISHAASAEQQEQCPNTEIAGNPPIYVPYPSGLIPPDLCSEVKRVQREADVIFKEALAECPTQNRIDRIRHAPLA